MAYDKIIWQNEITPVNADNLNHMEDGIANTAEAADMLDNKVASIETTIDGLLNMFYPVGSYYETSKSQSEFDPNTAWGGTWVLEEEGKVHIGAGENKTLGTSGGAETHVHSTGNHTLTVNELPAHSHGFGQQGGYIAWSPAQPYNDNCDLAGGNDFFQPYTSQKWHAIQTTLNTGSGWGHNHGNTGSSSNMMPYIVVNRWHRTA